MQLAGLLTMPLTSFYMFCSYSTLILYSHSSPSLLPLPFLFSSPFPALFCSGFLPKLVSLIAPGGYIVYSHFYEGAAHPTNLVMKGQLASVFTPEQGFDIIEDSVRLFGDGRPLTHFIARKRPM